MKFPTLIRKGTPWDFQKRNWGKGKGKKGKYTEEEQQKINKLKELYKEYRGLIRAGLPGVKNIEFGFKPSSKYGANIRKLGLTEGVHRVRVFSSLEEAQKRITHIPKENKYRILFGSRCFDDDTYLRQVMIHELMHIRFWKNEKLRHHTSTWRRLEKELFKKAGLPEQWVDPWTGKERKDDEKGTVTRGFLFGGGLLVFENVKPVYIRVIKKLMADYYFDRENRKELPYEVIIKYRNGHLDAGVKVPEIKKEDVTAQGIKIKERTVIEMAPISDRGIMEEFLIKKKGKTFLKDMVENSKLGAIAILNAYQLFHEIGYLTEDPNIFLTEEEADNFATKMLNKYKREETPNIKE